MRTRKRHRSGPITQRGIALISVSAFLAIVGIVTAEFSTDATIDYEAAANARDDMRAHFLARSGMNLGRIVIKVQTDILDKLRDQLGDLQAGDYLPYLVGAFGGSKEEVEAFAAMAGVLDAGNIKGLGVPEGEFDIPVFDTDDGKINLNCANGSDESRKQLQTELEAMLYPEAYDVVFQYEDGEGWRRDRVQQVAALIDYVDRDNTRFDAPGTPEDYGYEALTDKYEAKNNYVDTVGELALVRGVDDRFWTLFGGAFTVYGGCKKNVGAMRDVNVIASTIYVSAKNPDDPVLRDPIKLWALAHYIAGARAMGVTFDDLEGFASFVKDPAGALAAAEEGAAAGGGTTPPRTPAPADPNIPAGVELDPAKLAQVARAGPRRTYRVEVTAAIGRNGRVRKRVVGIWDTNIVRQNSRARDTGRGAWVYWREE
jgi:general secretion pathway protein K